MVSSSGCATSTSSLPNCSTASKFPFQSNDRFGGARRKEAEAELRKSTQVRRPKFQRRSQTAARRLFGASGKQERTMEIIALCESGPQSPRFRRRQFWTSRLYIFERGNAGPQPVLRRNSRRQTCRMLVRNRENLGQERNPPARRNPQP